MKIGFALTGGTAGYVTMRMLLNGHLSSLETTLVIIAFILGVLILAWGWLTYSKVTYHSVKGHINRETNSCPYKLKVVLRLPELMNILYITQGISQEIVHVEAHTKLGIRMFLSWNSIQTHSRLISYTTIGPDGKKIEELSFERPSDGY